MALVVDASVAFGWLFPEQATALTDAALDEAVRSRGCVPAHFPSEIGRALRRRERFHGLSPSEFDEMIDDLRGLYLTVDETNAMNHVSRIAALARTHLISFADVGYLELAIRLNLPLATRDQALAQATRAADGQLFVSAAA